MGADLRRDHKGAAINLVPFQSLYFREKYLQKAQFHTDDNKVLAKLIKGSRSIDYFAFYITSERDFKVALGAKRKISLPSAKGAFDQLRIFQAESKSRIAGFLGYDLKGDLEGLVSENPDFMGFPETVFFEPEAWISFKDGLTEIASQNQAWMHRIQEMIGRDEELVGASPGEWKLKPSISREEYIAAAEIIKGHLQRGDIYEANYCFQFGAEQAYFDPAHCFLRLLGLTKAPFSVFAKFAGQFIISASPERYLKNTDGLLISQPIKGTARRATNAMLDDELKKSLCKDPKEQSENVMIVDLVRNDLSRVAARGSVRVADLFKVKTFETVHHLVSTIEAQLDTVKYDHWDAIKASFPMGSMTGAPKISAMQLMERYENFKRGAYSGAFGWMDVNGDFDFNVMIRTLLYNENTRALSLSVGSAITIHADPEKEYEECLLKASALLAAVSQYHNVNEPAPTV